MSNEKKEIKLLDGKLVIALPNEANIDTTTVELLETVMIGTPSGDSGTARDSGAGVAGGAIQFECGDCCKEVLGFGPDGFIFIDLPEKLVTFVQELLLLKAFSNGKLFEKQAMRRIQVPFNRFRSAELNVVELDPKLTVSSGLSRIAIEFECGECCKKVLNISTEIDVFPGLTILIPPRGESLLVKTFSSGELVDLQLVSFMVLNGTHICSREFNVKELDF